MARYTHGAPPPIPDFGSTPVDRQGGFLPATMPNAPDAGVVGYTPPAMAPVQIFPWWLYQYESAQAFYIKSLNFMVAASTITPVPTFTFTVPQQMRGVLQSIEMTVQSSTAAMNLQLTLLVQNAPLQGWSGVAFPHQQHECAVATESDPHRAIRGSERQPVCVQPRSKRLGRRPGGH